MKMSEEQQSSKKGSEPTSDEHDSSRPLRRMPLFGIKTIACVILLALGSGASLHSALLNYVTEQENGSIQAVLRKASEALPAEEMEDKEQFLATATNENHRTAKDNTTSTRIKETSSSFKVANYSFPSVQQRLQYYMGDWYNKSHWTVPDSDCRLLREETDYLSVHDMDIMMQSSQIKECIHKHTNKGTANYCRDAYDMISSTLDEADNKNNRWIFSFGDRAQGFHKTLPIITKARQSALSNAPQPMVWLLTEKRHFGPVEDYHRKIVKQGKEVPWSEKLSKVFWRGSTTGKDHSRLNNLAQWINYDDTHTDIAFSKVSQMKTDFRREYVKSQYVREKQSFLDMNKYKYLLSVEGNDVATGLKWMLYSNSVVFMSRPTVATWAMEDLLVPFVHYIPLANDYSNLLEMIKWANEHDEACQEISNRATEFIEHLWISEQAQKDTEYLQKALVTSYVNQFDDALSKCAPPDKKERASVAESSK